MRWLKSYSKYQESIVIDIKYQSIDLSESLNIDWHDILLKSISVKEIDDFVKEFKMKQEDYKEADKLDLVFLCGDGEDKQPYSKFINSLKKEGLRISNIIETKDSQTFINKPCKFMFIYKQDKHDLQDPEYMMFQVYHQSDKTWTPVKLYKVEGNVSTDGKVLDDFYTKLSSRTIRISISENDKDDTTDYIYSTSNGNEWELKSGEPTDEYKKVLRNEELEELIKNIKENTDNKEIKLTII
jgi:hypothetical protein